MTKKQTNNKIKLAEAIIKGSTRFKIAQIDYTLEGDCICLWSTPQTSGTLSIHEVMSALVALSFNMYVDFNRVTNRCELFIF